MLIFIYSNVKKINDENRHCTLTADDLALKISSQIKINGNPFTERSPSFFKIIIHFLKAMKLGCF